MSYPGLTLVVRTDGDPNAVLPLVRRELRALDASIPLSNVRTLDDVVATSLARQRFSLTLLGAFGIAALLLAIVGLYGVIALSVGERRRELGVRIALGARRRDVLSLVLGEGARLAAAGVLVGLGAAYGASRVMQGMLFGISATDPVVYIGAAAVVVIVALLASWLPARSATRVDPVVALRSD
jgi:ABC-type antimicrobial peptide transport system permease subunit